jgi:hypothetical protein
VSEIEWVEKELSKKDRLRLIEIAHESRDGRVREHAISLLNNPIMAHLPSISELLKRAQEEGK